MYDINTMNVLLEINMFVCVDILQHRHQLRSCLAGQLPVNTVLGQA